jgi:hypothetical protein
MALYLDEFLTIHAGDWRLPALLDAMGCQCPHIGV